MKRFEGRLYIHDESGSRSVSCTIMATATGLKIESGEKVVVLTAADDATFHLTSGTGFTINIKKQDCSYSVMIKNRRFLQEWRTIGIPPGLETKLEEAKLIKKSSQKKSIGAVAVILTIILVLVTSSYIVLMNTPRWIADALPFSIDLYLGKISKQEVSSNYKILQTTQYDKRVKNVAEKLEQSIFTTLDASELEPSVQIIDSDEVNAFCLPGGSVFIYRGLLELIETDDELAAVLAHEFMHAAYRHGLRNMISGLGLQAVIFLFTGGADIQGVLAISAAQLGFLAYSRSQEYEADAGGVNLLNHADYSPSAYIGLFTKMKTANAEYIAPPELLSTHPDIDKRIERIEAEIVAE